MLLAVQILAQDSLRPHPVNFPNYKFKRLDSTFQSWYTSTPLFAPLPNPSRILPSSMAIFDENGYLRWYSVPLFGRYFDLKYYPKHHLYSYSQTNGSNLYDGAFKVLDTSFNVVDSIVLANGFDFDLHEFIILDNGNYLISGASDSIVDLSHARLNSRPGSANTHLLGFVIQELDSNHNVVFEWNSNDHMDPLETYERVYGYDSTRFDYCHGNAVEKDLDSNYLVSFRHTNSIYKIDKNTGSPIWKLGGKASDFSFPNDSGFSGQHDIRRLPNGNISLFDNGNMSSPRISRAVEYELDTFNWTATKVWEYSYSTPFFAQAMGSHQTTTNREHLINYGLHFRLSPSFLVVDSSKKHLVELTYLDTLVSYRSFAYAEEPPVQSIAVACTNQNGIITLTASGSNQYIWSTGDTTAGITVLDTGTYQVWGNKGIGMLGSKPIFVKNLSSFCRTTSIADGLELSNEELIIDRLFDIKGRVVSNPRPFQIYILRYTNGKTKKIVWLEDRR